MEKEKILQIMDEEYCKRKVEYGINKEMLVSKLIQTTEQFARSFDYELPIAEGIRGHIFRFIKRIIRKGTRFITKPYAEQMLKFQENICELAGMYIEKLNEVDKTLGNHEEAIYKLTKDFNDNTKLTMELSDSIAQINQYLFGEEKDNTFRTYAQAGEDAIISFILEYLDKKGASYLDIGCNDYKKLSNTFHFYEKGMRGVLVDANPKYVELIKEKRPGDVILNVGVGERSGEVLPFYILNGDGLSSFNKEVVDKALKETEWLKIENIIEVPIMTVNELIEQYFYTVPTIISIDIEGDELAILKSIDMERYRPLIYIVETIEYRERIDLDNKRNDIIDFMKMQNYKEYAFTGVNSIFLDEKQL